MKILIMILMIICIIICILKSKNKEKKNYITISLLCIILLIYTILAFSISFSSKITYNMEKSFSSYEYKESFEIDNNLILVISEKSSNDEIDYDLTLQNKFIGLYFSNDKKYSQGIMITGNEKLDVNYIMYNNKYYYYFNSYKGITTINIDNELIDISNLKTYIYISEKRIDSLQINSQTYSPYHVQVGVN